MRRLPRQQSLMLLLQIERQDLSIPKERKAKSSGWFLRPTTCKHYSRGWYGWRTGLDWSDWIAWTRVDRTVIDWIDGVGIGTRAGLRDQLRLAPTRKWRGIKWRARKWELVESWKCWWTRWLKNKQN